MVDLGIGWKLSSRPIYWRWNHGDPMAGSLEKQPESSNGPWPTRLATGIPPVIQLYNFWRPCFGFHRFRWGGVCTILALGSSSNDNYCGIEEREKRRKERKEKETEGRQCDWAKKKKKKVNQSRERESDWRLFLFSFLFLKSEKFLICPP